MLLSKNIIIDTQFFVSKKFDFGHVEFKSLKTLVEQKLITVFLTEVTKREIRKKMADQAASTFEKLASKDTSFLSIAPEFKAFSGKYGKEDIIAMHEKALDSFCAECKVQIIRADTIDIMAVFEDYCMSNPPFGKKEDKKSEFPDALALASIVAWAASSGQKAYLLSNDGDWKAFVEAYHASKETEIIFECVSQLKLFTTKVYHAEKQLEALMLFTDSLVEYRERELARQVCEKVQNAGYLCQSLETEAEITHVHILDAEITAKNVLSIGDEHVEYAIDFRVTGLFEFEVTSYEDAMWDAEDSIWRGEEYITVLQKLSFEVPAEVELSFEGRDRETTIIEKISIPRDFVIDYDDTDAEIITPEEWDQFKAAK